MSEPSSQARALIHGAKESLRPAEQDRQRIRSAIARSVERGGEPAFDGMVPPPQRRRAVALVVGAALALAAAAILLVGPPSSRVDDGSGDSNPASAVFEAQTEPTGGNASDRARRNRGSRAATLPQKVEPEPVAEPTDPPAPAPPPPEKTKDRRRPPTAAKSDIPGELAVLRQAREAMQAGNHDKVLSVVAKYRETYGKGAFAQEAAALRVLALCEAGKPGKTKAARRFLSRYPGSLNASRISKVCKLQ